MILLTLHQVAKEDEEDGNRPASALLNPVGALFNASVNLVVQLIAVLSIVTCHYGCNMAYYGSREDTTRILPPQVPIGTVAPLL